MDYIIYPQSNSNLIQLYVKTCLRRILESKADIIFTILPLTENC